MEKNPVEVIDELKEYQSDFLDLLTAGNRTGAAVEIARRIARLRLARVPGATCPFLMRLTRATHLEEVQFDDAVRTIDLIDSFLTRRAICGHEPTGLHAVFKRLWQDVDGDINAAATEKAIRGHKTVSWPTIRKSRPP